MRIGFLSSWDARCGIADYSRCLVEALRLLAEVEVVPASFRPSPPQVYRAMGKALSAGDVAHAQHSYAFFGGMHPLRSGWRHLAAAVTTPLVLTVHELDDRATGAYRLPPTAERAYKRRFNRATFLHPRVGAWLTHSEAVRDALLELGASEEQVTYRPMPVPPAPEKTVDPAPLRCRLGLEGKRALVILGFLSRRKGYETALAALRHLPPDTMLVAAGGAHEADATDPAGWLRAEARKAGVGERLIVTGFLPAAELEQAAALAAVVLAPFTELAASSSVSYALARGKPVVASDLPGLRGLGGVRYVPPRDPEALAEAVRELAASREERERLSAEAQAYAAEHGYAALAREQVRIYRSLLGSAA